VRLLYSLAAYLLAPVYCAVLLARGLRERGYWQHFAERFGAGAPLAEPGVWLHAASVGEVQAAAALVKALRERGLAGPITLTTLTPAGAARARGLFAGQGIEVRHVPLDLPVAVRRFLDRVRPRLAIVLETEIWPNLYARCAARGTPLVIASARLSGKSVRRYRLVAALMRGTLAHCALVCAQSREDAERFVALGAPTARVKVCGNLKFDLALPPDTLAKGAALRGRYAAGRPVWVAGSTHAGEERVALDAHRLLRRAHPAALLVLAPRHPPRFAEVAQELTRGGVRFARRSTGTGCDAATEVLLVDGVGELIDFYAAADVAFVGGSLVPVGGHNLLEPAALGLPVLTGPNTANSREVARLLLECGAAQVVHDAAELGERLTELISDASERARRGASGRAVVEHNRGAAARLAAELAPLLAP